METEITFTDWIKGFTLRLLAILFLPFYLLYIFLILILTPFIWLFLGERGLDIVWGVID